MKVDLEHAFVERDELKNKEEHWKGGPQWKQQANKGDPALHKTREHEIHNTFSLSRKNPY